VSAESAGRGRGSEFVVRLPALLHVPLAHSARPTPLPELRHGVRGRRVLVVDDNKDGAQLLAELLMGAGLEVRTANDPPRALSLAESFRPELVILDIGLPVMDGYALARELIACMGQTRPILLALTGYGQSEDKQRSLEAGFAFHLVKPADSAKLLKLIDSLL
jgi:CheY-like chemotaxis protein